MPPFMLQPNAPAPSLKPERKNRKNVHRGERAYYYLHIAQAQNPNQDVIYRVVGDRGLSEANRLETEAKNDPSVSVERLNSRQYADLVSRRLKQIREGAGYLVGCSEAINLVGPLKNN